MNVTIRLHNYKRAVLLGIDENLPDLVNKLLESYMDDIENNRSPRE